jgi:hypothetical protein
MLNNVAFAVLSFSEVVLIFCNLLNTEGTDPSTDGSIAVSEKSHDDFSYKVHEIHK